jgi:hypothetical protein
MSLSLQICFLQSGAAQRRGIWIPDNPEMTECLVQGLVITMGLADESGAGAVLAGAACTGSI